MPVLDYLDVHQALMRLTMDFAIEHDIPVIFKGLPKPDLTDKTDWIRLNLLTNEPWHSPITHNHWVVEIAFTSLKAHVREDKRFDAPYRFWRLFKSNWHWATLEIQGKCLRSKEAIVRHLDNATTGQGFDGMSVAQPDSNTHTLLATTTFTEFGSKPY